MSSTQCRVFSTPQRLRMCRMKSDSQPGLLMYQRVSVVSSFVTAFHLTDVSLTMDCSPFYSWFCLIHTVDLFIVPEKRGRGYGRQLLQYLARLAVERDCGRMEWICLDWNENALRTYRAIGAIPMSDWTIQRLDEEALHKFA